MWSEMFENPKIIQVEEFFRDRVGISKIFRESCENFENPNNVLGRSSNTTDDSKCLETTKCVYFHGEADYRRSEPTRPELFPIRRE